MFFIKNLVSMKLLIGTTWVDVVDLFHSKIFLNIDIFFKNSAFVVNYHMLNDWVKDREYS